MRALGTMMTRNFENINAPDLHSECRVGTKQVSCKKMSYAHFFSNETQKSGSNLAGWHHSSLSNTISGSSALSNTISGSSALNINAPDLHSECRVGTKQVSFVYMCVCVCLYIYVCNCVHTRTHTHIYIYISIYIYMYMCVYIYIYI